MGFLQQFLEMYLGTIPVELDSFFVIFGSLKDIIIEMISSEEEEKIITENQINKNIKSGNKKQVIEQKQFVFLFHFPFKMFNFLQFSSLKHGIHAQILYQLFLRMNFNKFHSVHQLLSTSSIREMPVSYVFYRFKIFITELMIKCNQTFYAAILNRTFERKGKFFKKIKNYVLPSESNEIDDIKLRNISIFDKETFHQKREENNTKWRRHRECPLNHSNHINTVNSQILNLFRSRRKC